MTPDQDNEDTRLYIVLINAEEQYSLWPKGKAVPAGWREAGKEGTRSQCMAYVDATWLDMRPLSLRRAMSGQ
jgi:MbtH protein